VAETTDVREWLREHQGDHGQEVPGKGRIPAHLQAVYDQAHPGDEDVPGGPVSGEADYDGGVDGSDFVAAEEPAENAVERPPKRVRAARKEQAKSLRQRIWGGGDSRAARPKKKHPRVSLKGFAEDMFLDLAWTFQGLPPMEKILYLQAPLAGQVVEDTCKGTIVDTVLQPVARIDRQFKAFEALTAPVWVAAIMARGEKEPVYDAAGNVAGQDYTAGTKMMFAGLRHALLSMTRIASTDFAELREKADSLKSASGDVDAMIAWLFETPEPTAEQAAAMATAANGQAA